MKPSGDNCDSANRSVTREGTVVQRQDQPTGHRCSGFNDALKDRFGFGARHGFPKP